MTRNVFLLAIVMAILTVAMFVAGFTSASPGVLALAMMCFAPVTILCFGVGMGLLLSLAQNYELKPRSELPANRRTIKRMEPLS